MIQIRPAVFETNSSSTHSLAIPFKLSIPSTLSFKLGEFGWDFEEVNAADYFYTAIYASAYTLDDAENRLKKLQDILRKHNVKFTLGEVRYTIEKDEETGETWFTLLDGGIDHAYELTEFVDQLLNDDEQLMRFLGGGLVLTGNDECEDEGFLTRELPTVVVYDSKTKTSSRRVNKYYMSNHANYEWYYK